MLTDPQPLARRLQCQCYFQQHATGPNFGVLVNIDKSLVICIDGLNHLKWGLFDNFCEKMFSSTSKIPAYGRPVI